MSEEKKQNHFWKDLLKSVKDLDQYEDFALELPKKSFQYFLKLILIFAMIIGIFYTYKIVENMNSIYLNLKEKLPDFSYQEGNLTMESSEPIVIDDYQELFGRIIINTNLSKNEVDQYEKEISNKEVGVLFLKDQVTIIANHTTGQVTYDYAQLASTYGINQFTKQEIVEYIEGMNKLSIYGSIYFVMFIYLLIIYFISIFMDVLLLSVLTLVISRLSRLKLKFTPSFNIAVHSITLPVLLNLAYIIVNLLTGFKIKYFQLMYTTISYIYVIVAVLMIKTDFINRQIELIKLAQEQEKMKEEMKRKEEEEKKKESEKENEKEKQEESKEKKQTQPKKKKKKSDGSEEGVGADAPACQEIPRE